MLDGRVLEASQVEYKPFGKPPLQREAGRRGGGAERLPPKEQLYQLYEQATREPLQFPFRRLSEAEE